MGSEHTMKLLKRVQTKRIAKEIGTIEEWGKSKVHKSGTNNFISAQTQVLFFTANKRGKILPAKEYIIIPEMIFGFFFSSDSSSFYSPCFDPYSQFNEVCDLISD